MSIATEISRIRTDRNTIRNKLVELGMATSVDNLTKLAEAVDGITNRGAVTASVKEGETYTIPKGYHSGSGTVAGVSGGGNYTLQSNKPVVNPTKKQQNITPDSGYYGLAQVTVAPIPDSYQDVSGVTATENTVLTGKVFVKSDGTVAAGTMPKIDRVAGGGMIYLDTSTGYYHIPQGYHAGDNTVAINPQTEEVEPKPFTQEITPSAGRVLSKVTVKSIPSGWYNTDGADVTAAALLDGYTAYGSKGEVIGMMPNNGATGGTFDGLTTTSYTIPAGYTTGGTVSLTGDIEEALAAI